jgi:hypothetical protein
VTIVALLLSSLALDFKNSICLISLKAIVLRSGDLLELIE